jgi:hypothetical protein
VVVDPCESNLMLKSAAEMLVNTDVVLEEFVVLLASKETFVEFLEKTEEYCWLTIRNSTDVDKVLRESSQ